MLCSLQTDEHPAVDLGHRQIIVVPGATIRVDDQELPVVAVTPIAYSHDPRPDEPVLQIIVSPPSDPVETMARMKAIVDSMQRSQITHDFEEREIVEESE